MSASSLVATAPPAHSRRAEETRERIIQSAKRLFAARGYRGTTVRDIAREARITDAAIYYHFADKDTLLRLLIGQDLAPLRPASHPFDTDGLSLGVTLRTIAERALSLIDENSDVMRIVLLEALGGNPQARRRYREWTSYWERRLTTVLQRFEDDGLLPGGEGSAIARQALATLVFACEDALLLRPAPHTSREERRERLTSFVASALSRLHFVKDDSA